MPLEIYSEDITRSNCPIYLKEPYGARTKLSSCIAVGLVDPAMYYAHCKTTLRLNSRQKKRLATNLNIARGPVSGKDGTTLFPPYVVVCHDIRYRQGILTGIIRILGIGKFGEFATFTLEDATKTYFMKPNQRKRNSVLVKLLLNMMISKL